ncbi:Pst1p NDAI_0A05520 [Naumovozyma dairenensis CBS 421]|uniref:Receptor L-domain domain-containing protein n=1 Tax=Naumovozyma dairenensis (strain ATCC 10597 / BCRC 20456 / CBS 421 / NBRC 0211 / NRRL Y-12639) TaxID=1071378 RepID=G0W4G9_NAUDC|nr:hypothetical protein NDAI_0A05520 [Naumovozyma dairenensis CBS 421]CCD22707.1 hypothetical protein NDAI_0A05520 [Naumovozyma dairenensis CBS 421]
MQFKSTILATALLSVSASAASIPSQCSIGTSATATAQADLDKYAGCETLYGNLTITGELGSAALANVQKIDGSLKIFNATSLGTFSADSIESITGALDLQSLTILTSASFGSLKEVDSINLVTLPAITTFASNLETANNIYISDTSLESVDGFSVLQSVNVFNINNNRYLTSIKSSLKTVSDSLQFDSNGDDAIISFDNLIWANNITLRDVNQASFASLQTVNASMGFINNSIESLNISQLSKVGQTFTVVSNDELTKLQFPNLTAVGGGFVVANNTALKTIDGFKNLSTVGGAIIVTGNFTELDLSSLKSVRGGADFETKSGNFSCSPLKKLQQKGSIQGDSFVCKNGAVSSSKVSSKTSSHSSSATSVVRAASSTISSSSSDSSSTDSSSNGTSSSSSSSRGAGAQFAPASSFMGAIAAIAVALL